MNTTSSEGKTKENDTLRRFAVRTALLAVIATVWSILVPGYFARDRFRSEDVCHGIAANSDARRKCDAFREHVTACEARESHLMQELQKVIPVEDAGIAGGSGSNGGIARDAGARAAAGIAGTPVTGGFRAANVEETAKALTEVRKACDAFKNDPEFQMIGFGADRSVCLYLLFYVFMGVLVFRTWSREENAAKENGAEEQDFRAVLLLVRQLVPLAMFWLVARVGESNFYWFCGDACKVSPGKGGFPPAIADTSACQICAHHWGVVCAYIFLVAIFFVLFVVVFWPAATGKPESEKIGTLEHASLVWLVGATYGAFTDGAIQAFWARLFDVGGGRFYSFILVDKSSLLLESGRCLVFGLLVAELCISLLRTTPEASASKVDSNPLIQMNAAAVAFERWQVDSLLLAAAFLPWTYYDWMSLVSKDPGLQDLVVANLYQGVMDHLTWIATWALLSADVFHAFQRWHESRNDFIEAHKLHPGDSDKLVAIMDKHPVSNLRLLLVSIAGAVALLLPFAHLK